MFWDWLFFSFVWMLIVALFLRVPNQKQPKWVDRRMDREANHGKYVRCSPASQEEEPGWIRKNRGEGKP